ncbi:MAG TPA: ABC transporter substrate-binding protein [Vicinamibacterales bacterium]|jgi:NitT/TauT family transport system substrate-binding protein|nr:ABC transporter substrate-binding protein [Vicinamibacterales bacterium]
MIRRFSAFVAVAILVAGSSRMAGQAPAQAPPTPLPADALFTVAVATAVVEAAPVYMAKEGPFGARFTYINGGVRTLQNNGAHAAGNATTQMLVVLRDNPKVRLLFTLVDGNYRIVAKRSAGISRLADLKGKRIVTPRTTSAHYHLVALLRTAGLQESDVTLVSAPATAMAAAVAKGDADAISMWEPESQNTVELLGQDAITFQDNRVYREMYSIYSTTDVLNDPRRRKELVAFVREIIAQTGHLRREPSNYFDLISRVTKHPAPEIARSWEHHGFSLAVAPDLLNLLVEEEKWVANIQSRPPRSRAELASFIDTSIIEEARK